MIRDIESAINYGDSCDEKEWKELLKVLKEILKEVKKDGNGDNV